MEESNKVISAGNARCISVIVPVYKVEPYLRCCIDSVLAQTFTDFELILIDDGSPDNCGTICDEYAEKDDRVIVIHQENGGLSAARNAGLEWVFANSESQWITFVDSDDCVVPTYLEQLHRYAVDTGADITTTNSTVFRNETELSNVPRHVVSAEKLTGAEACKSIYTRDEVVCVSAWGKLFRKNVFLYARFPVGKVHEDDALVPQLLYTSKCVTALRAWMYCNRERPDSIINSGFSLRRFDRIEGIDSCIALFKLHKDEQMVALAQKFRDEVCATTVLRAWKYKLIEEVPKCYRMSLVKALYLTLCDSVNRGGVRFIIHRIGIFFNRPGK